MSVWIPVSDPVIVPASNIWSKLPDSMLPHFSLVSSQLLSCCWLWWREREVSRQYFSRVAARDLYREEIHSIILRNFVECFPSRVYVMSHNNNHASYLLFLLGSTTKGRFCKKDIHQIYIFEYDIHAHKSLLTMFIHIDVISWMNCVGIKKIMF